MYRFPWYLTLVSTNHASSNPGLGVKKDINFHLYDLFNRTQENECPGLITFVARTYP